jgi:hypothetical protein
VTRLLSFALGEELMTFRTPLLCVLSLSLISTPVSAQQSSSRASNQKMLQGAQRQSPHKAQDDAAADRLGGSARFITVLESGRADEAKKMLIADGASPGIVVGIERANFIWSSGGPSLNVVPPYTCSLWQHYWYWVWFSPPLTAPIVQGNTQDGSWNMGWRCVGHIEYLPPKWQ